MCEFIPATNDMVLRTRAFMALADLPKLHMLDKGAVALDPGPFSKDVEFEFKQQQDRRITADVFLSAYIDGKVDADDANKLISSGISFGPGEIYYKNQLVYKLELCSEAHSVRLDAPKDDQALVIVHAYDIFKFFIDNDVLELCGDTLRFIGLPDLLTNVPNPLIDVTVNLRDTIMAILAIDGDEEIIHPYAKAFRSMIKHNVVIANKPMAGGKYFPMELLTG